MKKIIHFLIATVFSTNAFADYWPQDKEIRMSIKANSGQGAEFTLHIPHSTEFKLSGSYYFRDNEGNLIRGEFVGGNGKDSRWSNMHRVDEDGLPNAPSDSGYLFSNTHDRAVGSAISTGVAHALYQGVIFDSNFKGEIEKISKETQQHQQDTKNNYKVIADGIAAHGSALQGHIDALAESLKLQMESTQGLQTEYASPNSEFVQNLRELENIFESNRSTIPKRIEARRWGLRMLKEADASSAINDQINAKAFVQYAEAFADIAVGLDPITGPIRDTYEAFTGRNLITGEKLDSWARGFAIVGAVTFGFGSKIARGIKAFRSLNKIVDGEHAIQKAIQIDAQIVKRSSLGHGAGSRASYEKMLTEFRTHMDRPTISDPELREFVIEYWHDGSVIGNGSTAAAYRWERLTGEKVGDRIHTQKMPDSARYFERWLRNNPNGSKRDRIAVENLLKDIYSALDGN